METTTTLKIIEFALVGLIFITFWIALKRGKNLGAQASFFRRPEIIIMIVLGAIFSFVLYYHDKYYP